MLKILESNRTIASAILCFVQSCVCFTEQPFQVSSDFLPLWCERAGANADSNLLVVYLSVSNIVMYPLSSEFCSLAIRVGQPYHEFFAAIANCGFR